MSDTDFLRSYLVLHNPPCPGCGYNLRGLTGSRCPECNQELMLSIGLVEPKIASFVAALIGLAAGAGFSASMLAFGLYVGLTQSALRDAVFWRIEIITGSGLLVEGGLLAVLLYKRREFRRCSAGVRGVCIAGAWMLSIAMVVVFMVFIR